MGQIAIAQTLVGTIDGARAQDGFSLYLNAGTYQVTTNGRLVTQSNMFPNGQNAVDTFYEPVINGVVQSDPTRYESIQVGYDGASRGFSTFLPSTQIPLYAENSVYGPFNFLVPLSTTYHFTGNLPEGFNPSGAINASSVGFSFTPAIPEASSVALGGLGLVVLLPFALRSIKARRRQDN